ncbi:unnamed protein product [Thlaspi arvense]|uniref:Leucine-rich repeat-containing N-terminal plant-type domain-containing protein n=1 Tax=Thlaspi arvense TaxID=13288 RepID=A0AAU9SNC8_THLAR|nr:unnamed protein product [Thlaspi arvense]
MKTRGQPCYNSSLVFQLKSLHLTTLLLIQKWNHGRWKGRAGNCCSWHGIKCDEITGHVIGLDISSSFIYGSINSNSSLFRLVHLQRLNLAGNNFNYSEVPSAIGSLSWLTHLDLSHSKFLGNSQEAFSYYQIYNF